MKEAPLRNILYELGFDEPDKSGQWLNTSCCFAPFTDEHSGNVDNSPSFGVSIDEEKLSNYYCFTCHRKGSISTLVRQLAHYRQTNYKHIELIADQAEADIKLPDWDTAVERHVVIKPPEPIDENDFHHFNNSVADIPEARAYIVDRDIHSTACKKADLRWDNYEKRIVFPLKDKDHRIMGFTGRTILEPENYPVYTKGKYPKIRDYKGLRKRFLIMGRERWESGKPVLITEGLFGYLSLLENKADEFFNVGAVLGSVVTDEQASILVEFNEPVYLLFDNDMAGDVGLFGHIREGVHEGGGAVDKLKNHLPLFLPEYEGFDDVDDITYELLQDMVTKTKVTFDEVTVNTI